MKPINNFSRHRKNMTVDTYPKYEQKWSRTMKELKLFKQGKKTMTSLEVTELINQFRAKEYEIKKK